MWTANRWHHWSNADASEKFAAIKLPRYFAKHQRPPTVANSTVYSYPFIIVVAGLVFNSRAQKQKDFFLKFKKRSGNITSWSVSWHKRDRFVIVWSSLSSTIPEVLWHQRRGTAICCEPVLRNGYYQDLRCMKSDNRWPKWPLSKRMVSQNTHESGTPDVT